MIPDVFKIRFDPALTQTFILSDETGVGLADRMDVDGIANEAEGGLFMGLPIGRMNRKELLAVIGTLAKWVPFRRVHEFTNLT